MTNLQYYVTRNLLMLFLKIKTLKEYNTDNDYFIPCHPISLSSYLLCRKFDHFSRRDTGFLRFGRKR